MKLELDKQEETFLEERAKKQGVTKENFATKVLQDFLETEVETEWANRAIEEWAKDEYRTYSWEDLEKKYGLS